MRNAFAVLACVLATGAAAAGSARADDATDVRSELDAMKRKIEAQDRKIRELENKAPTTDEISTSVDRYLASMPNAAFVGGADGGSAGFPLGKKPFIQEGPNKVNFIFRNQVRYEAFLYSSDAVGTLASPADTLSGHEPRDRSGFEIERLYFGIEGTIFCPNISYQLILNFDSDTTNGVEKEFAWLDWKYTGEHHVRAGTDKVPFTYEEQNSTGSLAFCDRGIVTKAFAPGSDTGVALWGYFGDACDCPKRFLYKVAATTGEGPTEGTGSVFNTDAFDTYSDQLLFSGYLEWNITCKDWAFDEVDHRACEDRCRLDASLGICAMYENDDDSSHKGVGMALRSSGRLDRLGYGAWFRARYQGFSLEAEYDARQVDYQGSAAPTQLDSGVEATLHYRFAESNWGLAARYGIIWLDDDYSSVTVGNSPPVAFNDTITEFGFAVNYFFWDHSNKITADVMWVNDNSAVSSSAAGYLVDPKKGVVIEDGVMLRIQWQLQF
jgi:hypothetical protein